MACPEGFVFGGLDGSLGLDLKSPLSPDPLMRVGDTTRTGRRGSTLASEDVCTPGYTGDGQKCTGNIYQ